jgi:hypothetical protein
MPPRRRSPFDRDRDRDRDRAVARPNRPEPERTAAAVRRQRLHLAVGVLLVLTLVTLVVVARRDLARQAPSNAAATTAPPVERPAPSSELRQASAADPLRILVVGDSLVGWVPLALEQRLAGKPARVISDWKGSTGLARPDYFDWPARLDRDMREYDPDVVVMGFGGNDTQSLVTGDDTIRRGDPAWEPEYARRVGQVLDAVAAPGRTLWWIGLPLTERANVEELRPAITEAVRSEIATRPWAHYVDTLPVLSPDGTYAVFLADADSKEIRVRADDGIHPAPDGGRLIVDAFLPAVEAERGLG